MLPPASSIRSLSLRKDLRAILADGAAFSVMVGLGETYLAAYALALGASGIAAGLIATLPMLAGAVLQLASPWAVRCLKSHRRWVVGCAVTQAVSLLLVPLATRISATPVAWVFAAATLYWAAGLATGPAWNTWIEEIVPRVVRTHFFAVRVRIGQACVLAGFVGGGLWLQAGQSAHRALPAFAWMFVVAAACRFVSAGFLASQSEPSAGRIGQWHVGLRELSVRLPGHAGLKLVVYLLGVQIAVQMAGPYFTPYMISDLRLSYVQYMTLIGIAFLGKVIALPAWGKLAHLAGARRLLWIGGLSIVPMSAFWVVSDNFVYLAGIQLISGIAWAAYELAMMLMFFEAIPRDERTSVLTLYNLGNALALVIGSLVGAALLRQFQVGHNSYLVLFGLSSAARLATLALLVRLPTVRVDVLPPATRTIAVRPAAGSIERPILPDLPEEAADVLTNGADSDDPDSVENTPADAVSK